VIYPLGELAGLKNIKRSPSFVPPNEVLENAYRSNSPKLHYKELEALAKKCDLKIRQVERWMRKRNALDKPSTLAKFSESG